MSKLAEVMSKEEGFGRPGALPTRNHNPGDLRHAPGEIHPEGQPNAVGSFVNDEIGWSMLERQLRLYASRGLTIEEMIEEDYAPSNENDSVRYLNYVCSNVPCKATDLVSTVLLIKGSK